MSNSIAISTPRLVSLALSLTLILGACATTRDGPPARVVSTAQRQGVVEPIDAPPEETPKAAKPAVRAKPQTRTYAYREPGTEPEPQSEVTSPSQGQAPPATPAGPSISTSGQPSEGSSQATGSRVASGTTAQSQGRAPTESPAAPAPKPETQVASARPPSPPAPAERPLTPTLPPAADGLARQAELQRQQGDYAGAAATLERSLRIAPREAYLWNRLARVRMEQGLTSQAGQLAARSNDLAGSQENVKRDNWRIIAESRRRAGDMAGAGEAEQRAGGN